jgi:hypothetical protein
MLNDPNDQIVDGTFTLVQIHTGSDGLPSWGARNTFYSVTETPTAVFDGTLFFVGAYTNVQLMYNAYLTRYNQRRAVPTDVTITGTGVEISPLAHTYTVHARVCIESGGASKTMRIYMVQDLDHYGCSYCRYTFMQAATTQDIMLQPGECQVVSRTFAFNSTSWTNKDNIKIIIWAQEPQDSGPPTNPAEVYQACTLHWPLPAPDCNANGIPDSQDLLNGTSEDCNGNGIPDECDIMSGVSDDENDNGIPDECEVLLGDVNCDGVVNFGDINPFVLLMTSLMEWQAAYPDCPVANGDCNQDGQISFGDINPFIALLMGP